LPPILPSYGYSRRARTATSAPAISLCAIREGKVRAIGISTHDRKFAGKLAAEGALDVFLIRYNENLSLPIYLLAG
jgi:hypothetical protein